MFASRALARRIEGAEARLTLGVGRLVGRRLGSALRLAEIGGGAAVSSGESAPFDKVIGIGFEPLDWPAFDAFVERALADGRPVQVELATLADADVGRRLTRQGFELVGFEDVLGTRPVAEGPAPAPDIAIAEAAGDEGRVWIDTVTTGFLHPGTYDGPEPHESFARATLERLFEDMAEGAGLVRVLARRGGEVAGAASFRHDGGIAQLTGAATLPAHRRRGVQTALLHARLAMAARAGCDVAVVTTAPGSPSQANALRAGFAHLYTRAVLVKAPAS